MRAGYQDDAVNATAPAVHQRNNMSNFLDNNNFDSSSFDGDTASFTFDFEYDAPNVVVVRYEDFVMRPEAVLRGLLRLLGLPQRLFRPEMVPEDSLRFWMRRENRGASLAKLGGTLRRWEAPYRPLGTCGRLGYASCGREAGNFVLHDDVLAEPGEP